MSNDRSGRPWWQVALETLATVAFIAVSATFIWSMVSGRRPTVPGVARSAQAAKRVEPPPPSEPVSLDGAPIQGSKSAKVALIEYSDFQCPFCGKFAREILPELEQKYVATGKIVMAFRQLPLGIHPFAQKAAEASECAARQGKFWQMHNALFQDPKQLDETGLRRSAKQVGLSSKEFDACLSGQAASHVSDDASRANALGISGTPTFFAGLIQPDGRVKVLNRLTGAQPVAQFQAVLDPMFGSIAVANSPQK